MMKRTSTYFWYLLFSVVLAAILFAAYEDKRHDTLMEECRNHYKSKHKQLTKWALRRICDKEVAAYLRSKSKN